MTELHTRHSRILGKRTTTSLFLSILLLLDINTYCRAFLSRFLLSSSSLACSTSPNAWQQHYNTKNNNDDGFDENPDLVGVKIEGFPVPPIPVREQDEALQAAMRRVPITSLHEPLKARDLTSTNQPLRVLIAGGGLGGLALASTLIRQQPGIDVHVLEQAVQYKPFGGPIQIQSNALWALEQINPVLYSAVAEVGVQTGDRLSGIKDGKRWQDGWLVKFDAATPAIKKGLPLTLAINRVVLQDIFLKYGVPEERVHTCSRVVGYEDYGECNSNDNNRNNQQQHGVAVLLEDGTKVYGDVLVGADGIWSRVRHQMYNLPNHETGPKYATKHARYSGYTCFTGTCQHTPDDIDEVAYKVFLGQEQYFGCTDCGYGWQHWWAFLPDPPEASSVDGDDKEPMLERLQREFKEWSPEIHDLFRATDANIVKKRPLFDRPPLTNGWTSSYVALLGDAAHPTLPNLGQGGAMATEDAYALGEELRGIRHTNEIPSRLKYYEKRRFVRASIAQFLSRNGSDLLVDWETMRNTPIVGPIAMWCVNKFQPISMNYLYSADI